MEKQKMNFAGVTALLVEGDRHCMSLLAELLRRFGLETQISVETGAEAKAYIERASIDLCFCEWTLMDMEGAELVRWMRRNAPGPVRFIPIIVLTGYSQMDAVVAARDAGASFVVKKPLSPQIIYDRLAWAAQSSRKFIESESYVGPDRRFKSLGPPDGLGRRSTDLSQDVGQATEPNMSQSEIDALMKPTRLVQV
jgi:DNA-binding response OmpR family regulator